ncbi:uncharacterized protein LOC125940203 isoform X2 [Dermacentor silvarum]|uniref:uncharacterized protein LOC125940203 isoform X2 n=1 Tax=Dermacentor silvarum TaxID=543639 RepID=UPI002100C8E6|nr:uncharacterized protein LOC125940203 isoform X2 [Dermacentor silvarum]
MSASSPDEHGAQPTLQPPPQHLQCQKQPKWGWNLQRSTPKVLATVIQLKASGVTRDSIVHMPCSSVNCFEADPTPTTAGLALPGGLQ